MGLLLISKVGDCYDRHPGTEGAPCRSLICAVENADVSRDIQRPRTAGFQGDCVRGYVWYGIRYVRPTCAPIGCLGYMFKFIGPPEARVGD